MGIMIRALSLANHTNLESNIVSFFFYLSNPLSQLIFIIFPKHGLKVRPRFLWLKKNNANPNVITGKFAISFSFPPLEGLDKKIKYKS